jgi:pimeloyl-ACP methyl ester carboxylesterase
LQWPFLFPFQGHRVIGKLVQTQTSDGVRLHGFLSLPQDCDEVWVLVHGVNSNFYSSSLLTELAAGLGDSRTGVLLVNTRGHDQLSFNSGTIPMRLGSQVETVGHCVLDLEAWCSFLNSLGCERVSLLGHSLGAIKVLLFASINAHSIERWIALSPPRLNTQLLMQDPVKGEVFREHLRDAVELCAAGNPDYIMKVRFPMPMWIGASAYADKYGGGDKYDYLRLVPELIQPGIWVFGQQEVEGRSVNFNQAHTQVDSAIQSSASSGTQQVFCVPGADHSYHERRRELLAIILEWLRP